MLAKKGTTLRQINDALANPLADVGPPTKEEKSNVGNTNNRLNGTTVDYTLRRLARDKPEMLIKHRPKGKRGGDRKSEEAKIKRDNVTVDITTKERGNSRIYLEDRLQRDHKARPARCWRKWRSKSQGITNGRKMRPFSLH